MLHGGQRQVHANLRRRRKDDKDVQVSVAVAPVDIQVQNGRETYRVHSISDRSEVHALNQRLTARIAAREKAESALIQEAKIAAVGRTASTIIHAFSQPLTAIQFALDVHDPKRDEGLSRARKTLGDVRMQTRRMRDYVQAFRQLVAGGEPTASRFRLREAIAGAIELLRVWLRKEGVAASEIPKGEPIDIHGHAGQLMLVLITLFENAVVAMRASMHKRVVLRLKRESEQRVSLAVIDSGPGLADIDNPERLFAADYTSKCSEEGGLGLAFAVQLVRQAFGGDIRAETDPETGGACFAIFLPYQADSDAALNQLDELDEEERWCTSNDQASSLWTTSQPSTNT